MSNCRAAGRKSCRRITRGALTLRAGVCTILVIMANKKKLILEWINPILVITAMVSLLLLVAFNLNAPFLTKTVSAAHVPVGCPGAEEAGPLAPGTVCPNSIKTDCNVPLSEVNNDDANADNDCEIIRYLLLFINGLSALVGIVIVGAITVGGIQYSAAGDNPQATMAAKKRIGSAIGALLLYIFMFAFLQWIVPGGVF